ncbi:MAG: hypothetical protein NZ899_11245 [Thermoguttaceae bacterium]|nr:hypothetical protein [Thermoguttaceae bacterium]MDW8077767.1 hypothetical protein [Thermoguttaceae bacterium]
MRTTVEALIISWTKMTVLQVRTMGDLAATAAIGKAGSTPIST